MKIIDVEINSVGIERDKQISKLKGFEHTFNEKEIALVCTRCKKSRFNLVVHSNNGSYCIPVKWSTTGRR